MFFTYAYLLRVPVVGGMIVAGFAPFALIKGSQFTTLLEGLFDLDFTRVALVAFLTLVAASACAIASELVLRYGGNRFYVKPLPSSLRQPLFRLFELPIDRLSAINAAVYFLCASVMLVGLAYGANHAADIGRIGGVGVGILGFFAALTLMIYVWANSPPALARYLGSIFRWTPDGYVQTPEFKEMTLNDMQKRSVAIQPKHRDNPLLLPGHGFAAVATGFTLVLYAILGFAKWWYLSSSGSHPVIPTLACILLLITLVVYLFAGIAFLLDRFRIPFVAPLILIFLASADWPQSDHYFEVISRQDTEQVSPAAVLRQGSGSTAVVVAASGGGIQAAAWTAAVLTRLHMEMPGDFARRVRAISSVSGGSVGTMYFVDAYRGGSVDARTVKEQVFDPSATSSLDDIAWGVVYPDLIRLFAPFFNLKDRGWAAENAWGRFGNVKKGLSSWRSPTRDGLLPAVIFNATVAETGSRFVLSTTDLKKSLRGRRSFYELYPKLDVPVVTAARLSASFPYVSPAARARNSDKDPLPAGTGFHFVDGGYYDNFGISSIADWLLEAMPEKKSKMTRILLIQIRGPIGAEDPRPRGKRRGFFYQAGVPPATVVHTRTTGQISHNNAELKLLCEVAASRGVSLETALFQFPAQDTPLSWHLTSDETNAVWNAYDRCKTDKCTPAEDAIRVARNKVKNFLAGSLQLEGCQQFEEPPKPAPAPGDVAS
jgi:Patatin-like phospholipase